VFTFAITSGGLMPCTTGDTWRHSRKVKVTAFGAGDEFGFDRAGKEKDVDRQENNIMFSIVFAF
jgi:hypothetical protein